MRDGLTYFDQAYAFTGSEMDADSVRSVLGIPPTELFFELIQAIEKHDLKGCFLMVDKAVNRGIEFAPLLDGFGKFLRNLIYSRLDAFSPEDLNISAELYSKFKESAQELSNGDLLRISKMLIDLQAQIRYSSNPRLLVETTFARMAWLDRLTDLRRALAAINDPKSAADEALKKKATEVQSSLDREEASSGAPDFFPEQPSAYTRYEITAAWPSILASLAECGDLQFSAAVNSSVLEAGDIKQNPFPLFLSYVSENGQSVPWGYQQMCDQPEFLTRVKNILEDKLQTKIDLKLRIRALTEEERISRETAQKSPFEKDMQNEPGLAKLVEFLGGELIYSKLINKQVDLPMNESGEENTEN